MPCRLPPLDRQQTFQIASFRFSSGSRNDRPLFEKTGYDFVVYTVTLTCKQIFWDPGLTGIRVILQDACRHDIDPLARRPTLAILR
jgi:hypothetical protein